MSRTFTEELERRLRAVLSLRVEAPLPSDIPIEIAAVAQAPEDAPEIDTARPLLEIRTKRHPYAAWSYEEPGAWEMLLADLAAIPDPPQPPEETK
jgi:hypothetical protein